jgi:hypothetical protein
MTIEYERLATLFLEKFDLVIHADLLDDVCPPWCDGNHIHGKHYLVTVMDKGEQRSFEFDFWESEKDKDENNRPNNYPILAMVSSTIDADPWDADEATLQKIAEFTERAKKFFTGEELKELQNLV